MTAPLKNTGRFEGLVHLRSFFGGKNCLVNWSKMEINEVPGLFLAPLL